MKAANPYLYEQLKLKFGKVSVSSSGTKASYTVVGDPLVLYHNPKASKHISWDSWGETYSMNCPKCGDRKGRLYIGHLWGVRIPETNRRVYSCVKCHNESCDWSDLWDALYSTGPAPIIDSSDLTASLDAPRKMELPGAPEDITPVTQLSSDHPAVEYLMGRGFTDLNLLVNDYNFCYCVKSPWKKCLRDSANQEYCITPEHRLIIPNIQKGVWQGWMARFIGDIPKDPNTGKPLIQKYLNAPGYSLGSTVYNLDRAKEFSAGKFAIVCEGALSAIACGTAGVATFGMYPRPMQEEVLADTFGDGKLIFLVEAEAHTNGRIHECIGRLSAKVKYGCVTVELPKGLDAANMQNEQLLKLIEEKL